MKKNSSKIVIFFLSFFLLSMNSYAQQWDWDKIGDETVSLLQDYLKINTSNPPGHVDKSIAYMTGMLDEAGVPYKVHWTDRENNKGNIVARLRGNGSKRPIVMLNHMDTVPVNRDGWSVDPFGGVIKDGNLYGRGALDMKNYGAIQLKTILMLKQSGIQLERDVILMSVADEEVSGAMGAGWIVNNIWDEINAEYILDEGGFGTQGFFTNDNRLIFSVGVAEKKVLWLRLSVSGTEGHGSMPPKDNANFIMARALANVANYQTPVKITPVVQEMINRIGPLADTPYNNAVQRNTISLTVMKAFVGDPPKSNVIPDRSEAVLDCRLLPGQDPEEFIRELKRVINDDRIKFENIEYPVESIVSNFNTDLFRAIETETKKVFPQSVTLPHLIIYGTDSRFFRPKGAICYGFFPGPVSMGEYRKLHGNDESVRVASLRSAVRIYYNVVKSISERKN